MRKSYPLRPLRILRRQDRRAGEIVTQPPSFRTGRGQDELDDRENRHRRRDAESRDLAPAERRLTASRPVTQLHGYLGQLPRTSDQGSLMAFSLSSAVPLSERLPW